MGRKSSITQLEPELRAELDRLLKEDKYTIAQVVEHLRGMGGQVSHSAVGRYHKNFEAVGKRMREAREVASVWAEKLVNEPESDLAGGVIEMLRTLSFNAGGELLDPEAKPDAKALFFLSMTMKNIEGAAKTRFETQLKARKVALEDAARKVGEMAKEKKAGLTPEMAEQIKREFLGMK